MTEEKTKASSSDTPLVPIFHTILASEKRTGDLFVKSFQYQGENIATKHLGQIFGFFEIPETKEDNAYIVNFLASVVKKEYFINPKRSATDSFEAALHKVNLALAELVRQGNTDWLGNLHGVVSVMENNTFHFSVTGDASILLYRENQVTCISEGLADKDAALHPLKTFLEISSGVLAPQDKILLTSPELFTLVPNEVLKKNAFRMDVNGFARFIRAAIVNELPLGVSMIVDMEAQAPVVAPKKKTKEQEEKAQTKLQNVFSGASFAEETKVTIDEEEEAEAEVLEIPQEYTDQKTGHIYVQGEMSNIDFHEPTAWQSFNSEKLTPLWKSFQVALKRFGKKSKKNVIKQAGVITLEGKDLSQKLWKASKEKGAVLAQKSTRVLKKQASSLKPKVSTVEASEPEPATIRIQPSQEPSLPEYETQAESRQRSLERFSPNAPRVTPKKSEESSQPKLEIFQNIHGFLLSFGRSIIVLPLKKKIFIGGGILLLVIILSFILFSGNEEDTNTSQNEVSEQASVESTPAVSTPSAPTLSNPNQIANWSQGNALAVVKTDSSLTVVTPSAILHNGKSIPFAADGTIIASVYMPDLRTLFLWSSKNELVSFNIVDQKFTANIFPLPANTTVTSLGSYLTYLYVLDGTNGIIYRFARIEGGFSGPTNWLKTALSKNTALSFSVTDNIRVSTTTGMQQFLQGNKEKTLSENTYQISGLSQERNFTLGGNTENGLLTVWDAQGNQVFEGNFEEIKGAQIVTYLENEKKLLIAKEQNLTEYNLAW